MGPNDILKKFTVTGCLPCPQTMHAAISCPGTSGSAVPVCRKISRNAGCIFWLHLVEQEKGICRRLVDIEGMPRGAVAPWERSCVFRLCPQRTGTLCGVPPFRKSYDLCPIGVPESLQEGNIAATRAYLPLPSPAWG